MSLFDFKAHFVSRWAQNICKYAKCSWFHKLDCTLFLTGIHNAKNIYIHCILSIAAQSGFSLRSTTAIFEQQLKVNPSEQVTQLV